MVTHLGEFAGMIYDDGLPPLLQSINLYKRKGSIY